MANLVFNIAKGRVAELYNRVDTNDPTNAALIVVAIATTDTDADIKDVDTLNALLALSSTAEATNSNYGRKALTDSDLSAISPDDTNDRMDLDFDDLTWSSVGATGGAWTDLVICYDSDTTGGTDANIIPLTLHDFSVTPNGGDITAQLSADGFYRAS